MLALKLLLVPAFIACISVAGKRWGPAVAGWLAGLPVVVGPILFLLALERGAPFAAAAATSALCAVFASVAFSLAYAWSCRRHGWPLALAAALAAWLAAVALLGWRPFSPFAALALALALATLFICPSLFPPPGAAARAAGISRTGLLVRMLAGAGLTLAVTTLSASIGSTWSGLLALFPVLGIVLSVFSHRAAGPDFVVALLTSMAGGLFSLVAFCFTLAVLLPRSTIAIAFATAILATAATQWAVKAVGDRRARKQPGIAEQETA
ncbi:hypothetical protein AB4156_04475 [Cupriavidus sp. 2MCAB6]|uniref:hypothetical protein n=1 Tax=Cupriavidus sp. 2MCAB6 TaxID=3232981 RepID=UPI003F934DD1